MEPAAKAESVKDFLDKVAFKKLKKIIHETVGLDCSGYRDEYIKRRFEIRLRATGAMTYGRYIAYLNKNPDEFSNLLNDLTINYTMFFRDADVYCYLEKTLLPKLLQSSHLIRIWSAGCASGEEPYSLAILLHKVLGDAISSHSIVIYASDIDKQALSTAAEGKYSLKQLSSLDAASLERFFTKEGEFYRVKDFVKRMVHFEQFDLNASALHRNLDVVLCRNVMIYFSKEGQQHIHMNFYNALKPEGYLITGKSEIMSGEPAQKFQAIDFQTRVYQKPHQTSEHLNIGAINFSSKISI